MAIFPSIKPTKRSFSMGEYPVKTYRALSGKVVRRSFGNRPFGATLDLSFENISEDSLALLYDHYHAQQGTTTGFTIPNETLAGLTTSSTLGTQLKQGGPYSGLSWFYAEVPSIESVYRGLSSVSVKLVAEFNQ